MGQIGQVYPPGKFVAQSTYSYLNPFGRPIGTWSDLGLSSKPFITVSAVGKTETGIINGGADFGPDTPGTQTSGIQEVINYVRSFANSETAYLPEIYLLPGTYNIHTPIYLKYTSTNIPAEINTAINTSGVTAPCLIGLGNWNEEGDGLTTPTGAFLNAASDFPKGEYFFALLLPTTNPWNGGEYPFYVGGKLENIMFWCNNLAAGVMLMQYADGTVLRIQINDPAVPNPVITQAPDSTGQSYQTGAFVYNTTSNSGQYTYLRQIDIRGSNYEDGFVIVDSSGPITGELLWCAGGSTRYGFNLTDYGLFPIILINPECDTAGGWTGAVPSGYPQAAGYCITGGNTVIINNNSFIGMQGNYPYVFNYGGQVTIYSGYYRAQGTQYVFYTSSSPFTVENATVEYNSSKNGVFKAFNPISDNNPMIFKNITYLDDNTGIPSVPVFSINYGSDFGWYTALDIEPFFDNRLRYFGGFPPSLQANPPVSGTIYQNQNLTKTKILLPVYATTSGTAGKVAVAMGNNQSGTNPPTIPTLFTKFINGSTSSGETEVIILDVPAGWYYSFTGTGVTFGTATVEAI